MAPDRDPISTPVVLGPTEIKERSLKAEFRLELETGEHRIVKYTERKKPDNSVEHVALEIELGDGLAGNIFNVGSGKSVGTIYAAIKGISLPFTQSLGDAIRDQFGSRLVQAFADYLEREEYGHARMLWDDALAITSRK